MTEVYIPVPNTQVSGAHVSFHVKDENEVHLSEGNYPVLYASDPAGISSDVSDPLATDSLFHVKEENKYPLREGNNEELHGTAPDRIANDAIDPLATDDLFHMEEEKKDHFGEEIYPVLHSPDAAGISSYVSDPLATDDYPSLGEDKDPVKNSTMAQNGTTEAFDVVATKVMPIQTTSTSYLLAQGTVKNPSLDECIGPTTLSARDDSKPGASHVGIGRNLMDKDLDKCGKYNGNSNRSNENSYHFFNCRDGFNNKEELINHVKSHCVARNFNAVAESSMGDVSLKALLSCGNSSSCEPTTSETLYGLERKRLESRQKGNVLLKETNGGKGDKKNIRRVKRSFTVGGQSTSQS